jgi:hypothetical protein
MYATRWHVNSNCVSFVSISYMQGGTSIRTVFLLSLYHICKVARQFELCSFRLYSWFVLVFHSISIQIIMAEMFYSLEKNHKIYHSAHLGRFVAHLTSAVSRNAPMHRDYFQNKWSCVKTRWPHIKRCDNNRYKVSVCVCFIALKDFSHYKSVMFVGSGCKAETHIKYCHTAEVWWRLRNHPRFAEWRFINDKVMVEYWIT